MRDSMTVPGSLPAHRARILSRLLADSRKHGLPVSLIYPSRNSALPVLPVQPQKGVGGGLGQSIELDIRQWNPVVS